MFTMQKAIKSIMQWNKTMSMIITIYVNAKYFDHYFIHKIDTKTL